MTDLYAEESKYALLRIYVRPYIHACMNDVFGQRGRVVARLVVVLCCGEGEGGGNGRAVLFFFYVVQRVLVVRGVLTAVGFVCLRKRRKPKKVVSSQPPL